MAHQSPTYRKHVPGPVAPASGPQGVRAADGLPGHSRLPTQRLRLHPDVVVVTNAAQLQSEVDLGARHVEIHEHLDLRTLRRMPAPSPYSVLGLDGPYLSLLYAKSELHSIRGNCSNPDPASVLGLSVEDAAGLLPLKPFQCLLITHESVLSVNSGNVWVDNLYLRAARGPLVDSDVLAFLFTPNGLIFNTRPAWDGPQDGDVRLYVTDTVFQAARRSAAGVLAGSDSGYRQGLGVFSTSVLIDGCVFTDWEGYQSPIMAIFHSVVTVRNTVFRSIHLPVEIADVSFDGTVRFENVSLANVTLQHGAVVSTSLNDYTDIGGGHGAGHCLEDGTAMHSARYYAYDDEGPEYDVTLTPAAPGEGGAFHAEFVIVDDAMSDCIGFMRAAGQRRPGCPEPATPRSRVLERVCSGLGLGVTDGDVAPVGADGLLVLDSSGLHSPSYYEYQNDAAPAARPRNAGRAPNTRGPEDVDRWRARGQAEMYARKTERARGRMLATDDQWLAQEQAGLPPRRPTPADWPAFVMPPTPPASSDAFSYAPVQPPFSAADSALLLPTQPFAAGQPGTAARVRPDVAAGIAVTATILLAAIVLAVRLLVRRQRRAARAANMKHVEMLAGGVFPGAAGGTNACLRAGGFRTAEEAHIHQLRVAKVMRHLDMYRGGDVLLLRQYELLSRDLSAIGGHSVVQDAFSRKNNNKYAVKVFLDRDHFRAEATLFAAFLPWLRQGLSRELAAAAAAAGRAAPECAPKPSAFLPPVYQLLDNADSRLRDARGQRLPPVLVLGKGMSLQEWAATSASDLFSAIAMLSSVAQRLAALHDAGYVHCALNPAKVILMAATRRWAVVGFSRAAPVGTVTPLNFTLAYAAPEAVRAFVRGHRHITADEALDAWALGVMAYEVLTGSLAFNIVTGGQAKVLEQLHGEQLLPWEGPRCGGVLEQLGMLRGPVLHLLERDPTRRATARQFHTACSQVFSNHGGPGA